MTAVPVADPEVEARRPRAVISGEVPSALRPPPGCSFHTAARARLRFARPTSRSCGRSSRIGRWRVIFTWGEHGTFSMHSAGRLTSRRRAIKFCASSCWFRNGQRPCAVGLLFQNYLGCIGLDCFHRLRFCIVHREILYGIVCHLTFPYTASPNTGRVR